MKQTRPRPVTLRGTSRLTWASRSDRPPRYLAQGLALLLATPTTLSAFLTRPPPTLSSAHHVLCVPRVLRSYSLTSLLLCTLPLHSLPRGSVQDTTAFIFNRPLQLCGTNTVILYPLKPRDSKKPRELMEPGEIYSYKPITTRNLSPRYTFDVNVQ